MKKLISCVCCLCCVVLVLAACLPLSVFAVDPVSAGVIANSFAQAIAAYGASNGVAMTFDVANTDGIGESVHELWKDFRAGTQDADDYATLAAALFPELYYKASSVIGGVADVYTVGYNISSTYAEEFDNFFDWLLSGPAEMVKVDNQYYQFSSSQIGSNASSIEVVSLTNYPLLKLVISASPVASGTRLWSTSTGAGEFAGSAGSDIFAGRSSQYLILCASAYNTPFYRQTLYRDGTVGSVSTKKFTVSHSSYYIYEFQDSNVSAYPNTNIPSFSTVNDIYAAYESIIGGNLSTNDVGVKAATNTGVAQFPDTSDANYEAVGKQIPSTVPWDNSAYGDGTGTLTDAQSGAIAAGADTVIAQDGVLDLVESDEITDEPGTDDPPSTDPDDYAVPGLAEIFPFCIPFDIYNFLSALSAQPVAPHFTATLDFPEAVGGTQTIDIDFDSPTWNQLAQLLRLLELLAFIIGLALLTRSMFLRG